MAAEEIGCAVRGTELEAEGSVAANPLAGAVGVEVAGAVAVCVEVAVCIGVAGAVCIGVGVVAVGVEVGVVVEIAASTPLSPVGAGVSACIPCFCKST